MQKNNRDSGHLGDRIGLSGQARPELTPSHRSVQKGGYRQNPQVAAKHQNCNRGGDQVFMGENDENGAEKELVGHWVKVLAEHCSLPKPAGQGPVQCVGQAGGHKQSKA
jgi:hypothetical protein